MLDFVCHADRAGGRFENSQDTVSGRIDHTTVMCGDSFAEDTPVVVECRDRGILVILHQARIASHIGAQDRRKPSSAIILVRHRENPARDTMVARGKMLRLFETALKAVGQSRHCATLDNRKLDAAAWAAKVGFGSRIPFMADADSGPLWRRADVSVRMSGVEGTTGQILEAS